MDKDTRLITVIAAIGLVVAALIFMYVNFFGEFDANLYTAFAILCPPSLVCIFLSEEMKNRNTLYTVWVLIGFANSGLYSTIAALVVGLRKKTD